MSGAGNLHQQTQPVCGMYGMCSLLQQDGEPVSKNAKKILEKGQEALDERTGAVEQHKVKVRGGNVKHKIKQPQRHRTVRTQTLWPQNHQDALV